MDISAIGALLPFKAPAAYTEPYIPLQTDDRELAQRNIRPFTFTAEVQITPETGKDEGWDSGKSSIVGAHIRKFDRQNNGGRRLNYRCREIVLAINPIFRIRRNAPGAKLFGAALAPGKNDLLMENCKSTDIRRAGGFHESLTGDTVEETYVCGVTATAGIVRFHINVRVQQFRLSALDIDGTVNGTL
jgi:hypothetical protein